MGASQRSFTYHPQALRTRTCSVNRCLKNMQASLTQGPGISHLLMYTLRIANRGNMEAEGRRFLELFSRGMPIVPRQCP